MIANIDVIIDDIWLRDPVPAFSLGNWDWKYHFGGQPILPGSPASGDRAKSWHTTRPCTKADSEVRCTYHKIESGFETGCADTIQRT
jgi:hypothetical protein